MLQHYEHCPLGVCINELKLDIVALWSISFRELDGTKLDKDVAQVFTPTISKLHWLNGA